MLLPSKFNYDCWNGADSMDTVDQDPSAKKHNCIAIELPYFYCLFNLVLLLCDSCDHETNVVNKYWFNKYWTIHLFSMQQNPDYFTVNLGCLLKVFLTDCPPSTKIVCTGTFAQNEASQVNKIILKFYIWYKCSYANQRKIKESMGIYSLRLKF